MSLNTAHLNGGVLIHSGECILVFSDHTTVEWSGQDDAHFKGTKHGRIYLTTHRVIFNSKDSKDAMQSFSFPFITLSDVELEQPIFGANYIKGKVRAQPNGNWTGEAKFKVLFKHGGAIEFGQAMLQAARMATRNTNMRDPPPPYMPPESQWYAAPPPAYAPPPQGYYGWAPPTHAFPDQPPPNSVFMTDAPPPYPGLNGSAYPPGQYPAQQQGAYTPPQGNYPPPQQGGYPPPSPQQGGGYPPQQGGGYPPPQQGGGYPPQGGYASQGGVPWCGFQAQGASGFQNAGDAKAAEAAQSAYYDPNRPQMAFVPPPAYYEQPPSYDQATFKKNQ